LTVDLTQGVPGNLIDDLESFRNFVVCKPLGSKGENFVEVYALSTIRQLNEASHSLTEIGIRHTDHRSVADRRMSYQDTLDFDRGDIRTAANNQVLLA
jgi:hypothetical protein